MGAKIDTYEYRLQRYSEYRYLSTVLSVLERVLSTRRRTFRNLDSRFRDYCNSAIFFQKMLSRVDSDSRAREASRDRRGAQAEAVSVTRGDGDSHPARRCVRDMKL